MGIAVEILLNFVVSETDSVTILVRWSRLCRRGALVWRQSCEPYALYRVYWSADLEWAALLFSTIE
jgi:hypothetical protein